MDIVTLALFTENQILRKQYSKSTEETFEKSYQIQRLESQCENVQDKMYMCFYNRELNKILNNKMNDIEKKYKCYITIKNEKNNLSRMDERSSEIYTKIYNLEKKIYK